MRKPGFFLICLLFPCLLGAQDAESPAPGVFPFPLGPLLAEAVYGEGRWRPDWPRDIAPDAFMAEGAAGVTVELAGGDSPDPVSGPLLPAYRLERDSAGRLSAFPAALPLGSGGALVFAQAELRRDGEGGILELGIRLPAPPAGESVLAGAPEDPEVPEGPEAPEETAWSVLFPAPYPPEFSPAPVTARCGDSVFYVLFSGGGGWIAETWYGPQGDFAAYFKTLLGPADGPAPRVTGLEGEGRRRDYRYESGGNLSEYSGDQGDFSALYSGQGRPLYWVSRRSYGLQWDERGLLRDMRDLDPGSGDSGAPRPAAYRYDYEFDSRGNWIRRRETALFLREGLLLPESMKETARRIGYAEGD
jgi:hypothetical protein